MGSQAVWRDAVVVWGLVVSSGVWCDQALSQIAPPVPVPQAQTKAIAPVVPAPAEASTGGASGEAVVSSGRGGYLYLPEGRRDPFLTVLRGSAATEVSAKTDEVNLPPLQRMTVAELSVIGIVWGGFGYMAMVQAPDGKGYAVQRGTRIGNNGGIISAITDKAVIVEERFTDIYGKKQVREYAKPLHAKESLP